MSESHLEDQLLDELQGFFWSLGTAFVLKPAKNAF